MFSLARALFSPGSAEDRSSLFVWFIDVGSEEARLRASLRPPLKLHVRFSRMQLSRRHMHLRSTLGLRVNRKLSVHESQPLSHTGETKPASLHCRSGVTAKSRIAYGETDCTQCSEQFNLEVPLYTVLRRIEQRFLQHSEEWKGNLQRHMAWHVTASEVNFDFPLCGELSAEGFSRCLYSQILQIRRAQSVRYRVKVGTNLGYALPCSRVWPLTSATDSEGGCSTSPYWSRPKATSATR
jgi:hypothetical protein